MYIHNRLTEGNYIYKFFKEGNRTVLGKRKVIVSTLLFISLLILIAFPVGAAFPGANGKIVFDTNRDSNEDIYVMDNDGTNPIRLTIDSGSDHGAAWSADGMNLAFHSSRSGNFDVFVMNADGSSQTNLTNHSAQDTEATWSPDGSQIAFQSDRDGQLEIYVMNADGSNQLNLTNHSATDYNPTWSPDGSKIAFTTNRDGNFEIYTMNSDGTGLTNLTNHSATDDAADWSPDGSKMAFITNRDSNFEVYSMNSDGSTQINLTNNAAFEDKPAWSPDGTQIAFRSVRDSNSEIYVMNADGSAQTNLTNNPAEDVRPDWQPLPFPLISVQADQDSILRPGAKHRNEGANPLLHLGEQRRLAVGFDLTSVDTAAVTTATLVLSINPDTPPAQWGSAGRTVDVHHLLEEWQEGNGKGYGLPNSEKTRGAGSGVTWTCATDADIANQKADCDPAWSGGTFQLSATDSVVHTNGMAGEVEFDVTVDIQSGADSWLIKKTQGNGNVRYYATDHPDVSGNPDLAPRLILEFGP